MGSRRCVAAVGLALSAALSAGTLLVPAAATAVVPRTTGSQPNLGLGIKLLDAALARRNDPRAHIEIDDFVHPGTTLVRHVLVSDITPKPMHLLTYASPAAIDHEQFTIAPAGRTSELTDWIQVSPSTLDLAPESSAKVTVTIKVPSSASTGERYGAVVAELPAVKPTPGHVSVASRVGIRIYLDVGKGGEPASNFTISTLTPERLANGTPAVSAQVTNTGGRALDLSGTLSLSHGPGGLRAGPFDVGNVPTLGIHQRGNVVVPLDKQTPAGPWLARMKLQSGYVKHAVQGTITFPTKAGTAGKPVKARPVPLLRNKHVLWPFALGLIVLLVLLFLFLLWRRRRRDEDEQKAAVPSPRTEPDTRTEAKTTR